MKVFQRIGDPEQGQYMSVEDLYIAVRACHSLLRGALEHWPGKHLAEKVQAADSLIRNVEAAAIYFKPADLQPPTEKHIKRQLRRIDKLLDRGVKIDPRCWKEDEIPF